MSQINLKQAAGLLLTGALAGVAVTLLSAPQSGPRTRRDLKKRARRTVSRLDEFHEDIHDCVADWVDDVIESVKNGVARGKQPSAEGYARVLQGFDNARKHVEAGKARIESIVKPA